MNWVDQQNQQELFDARIKQKEVFKSIHDNRLLVGKEISEDLQLVIQDTRPFLDHYPFF